MGASEPFTRITTGGSRLLAEVAKKFGKKWVDVIMCVDNEPGTFTDSHGMVRYTSDESDILNKVRKGDTVSPRKKNEHEGQTDKRTETS
jgi:hypothetical protein